MATVIYRCPISPDCPTAEQAGFCPNHPTDRLERDRGRTRTQSAHQAQPRQAAEPGQPPSAAVPPPTRLSRQTTAAGDGRPGLALQVAGERVEIPENGLVIGRSIPRFQALPLEVSRRHVRLFWHGTELCVLDVGSVNGTYVDGDRITTVHPLRAGDVLRLGLDFEIPVVGEFDDFGLPPI